MFRRWVRRSSFALHLLSPLREVQVLGKGAFGVVKLLEDPSRHDQIAVKFFNSETTQASDRSSAFFREIDALVLLTHPSVLRIVGYCLATRRFRAQIGTELAVGGSLREALPTLNDTGKAIVIVGIVLGTKFIHSQGVIHRYLKPANILLDERGHPKIGDLGTSRFCDLKQTMTSDVETPLYMAPEMYEDADYGGAVDVYLFALICVPKYTATP
jgi:serine/threonine protein kinase